MATAGSLSRGPEGGRAPLCFFTRVHASPSPVSLPPSFPQFSAHLPARLISQSTSGIQNLFSNPVSLQIYFSIPEVSAFSTLVGGTAFASLWVVVVCCSVIHSCPTLCDPMDCSPSRFSVHGILQARILEWVAMPSSRGSSPPRDRTCISYVSCTAGRFFP